MRVFLAIEIPRDLKEKLVEVQEKLKPQISGVRWEKPEKLHLTLIFLGKVEEKRVGELEEVVRKGLSPAPRGVQGKGFKVGLSGVRVFPSERRPRVVLVDVGDGAEQVAELQRRLAGALTSAGFEFARLKRPHVTLGRFTRQSFAAAKFRRVKAGDVGDFLVKEAVIVESKLHPAGAIHTPIAQIPL